MTMGTVKRTSSSARPGKRRVAKTVATARPITADSNVDKVATTNESARGLNLSGPGVGQRFAWKEKAVALHDAPAVVGVYVGCEGAGVRAGCRGLFRAALADDELLIERLVQARIDGHILPSLRREGQRQRHHCGVCVSALRELERLLDVLAVD